MSAHTERRRAPRYHLPLPIEFRNTTGITRDISGCGVSFETAERLSIGAVIRIDITFSDGRFGCDGTLVRVEPRGNVVRVAAEFDSARISKGDAARSLLPR
jgi:hypothetical protein